MSIKKEFIPFTIVFGIICLNIPIALLLYFLNPELIERIFPTIASIECIMAGLTIIYSEIKVRKNERKNYKVCDGIIKDTKFKLQDSIWIKAPVVSYIVDGKNYEAIANFGINGIFSFFLKGKKIKVYYKEENPEKASFNNNVRIIVGTVFAIVGILIFFI